MKKFTTAVSAAALVALTAPAGMAASIMIDDFNTFQQVADSPILPGITSSSTIPAGDVLGGDRTFTVSTNPSNPPLTNFGSSLTSTGLPESRLIFNNNDGQQGVATVDYGIAAGGDALGNLIDGTNDKFFFDVLSGDLPGAFFSATVTDIFANSFTVTELLVPGFSEFQAFSDFIGVDFTNVASLSFSLDSNGVDSFDGSIGSISAVPLPASALLLLGGLGGFAGLTAANRRRRRKET